MFIRFAEFLGWLLTLQPSEFVWSPVLPVSRLSDHQSPSSSKDDR